MTDFIHMKNIIQGEVIRIRERKPLKDQPEMLGRLIMFLSGQSMEVTVAKNDVRNEIRKANCQHSRYVVHPDYYYMRVCQECSHTWVDGAFKVLSGHKQLGEKTSTERLIYD